MNCSKKYKSGAAILKWAEKLSHSIRNQFVRAGFLCKRETKTEERTEEKQKCVLHLLKSETTKDNGAVESGRESGKVCVCVCMRLYTVHSFNM